MPNSTNTVVVVEDEPQILEAIGLVLECHGWTVISYANGEDFLRDINSLEPDCVLLDAYLSGMNASEVVKRIARPVELKPLDIIIITAHSDSREVELLKGQGITKVLKKPVTEQSLLDALDPYKNTVKAS